MKKLTTDQLRQAYLDYFAAKGHKVVKSDSLVPANDPSVLFTSAGMNQFKDHFLGKTKDISRATSSQKCFRTGDLEQVGLTPCHHTFFEMLGNFSFGDYFKKEAIAWAWEFVTRELAIDPEDLWVSVYQDDDEALGIWKNDIGLPADKIKKLGAKDNFWPSNAIQDGPNGPCGPCSEIYYQKSDGESVEVWNLVFTQFDRRDGGKLEPLPHKNIDTGMGLERMASVLQGASSNFEIDIFLPIVEAVKKCVTAEETRIIRMIADHARAIVFCIGDGVLPSNDGRGYVVRKLIRRCLFATSTEKPKPFMYKLVATVVDVMKGAYPDLVERRDNIAQIVKAEEEKYIRNILEGGSEKLAAVIEGLKRDKKDELPADVGLDLYVTYGIQPDFTKEMCEKSGISVDMSKINALIAQEQDRSRAASKMAGSIFSKDQVVLKKSTFVGYESEDVQAKVVQIIQEGREVKEVKVGDVAGVVLDQTPFYGESGGQVGDTGAIEAEGLRAMVTDTQKQDNVCVGLVRLEQGVLRAGDRVHATVDHERRMAIRRAHTATHILQAVLRQVLGKHVQQAGSYVEPDRFRFDFTHFKEISAEELADVQRLLNERVIQNDALGSRIMPKTEAQKTGAIALFGEKYEEMVRVVSVGMYSSEFCGGTHLERTGNIGLVLIMSDASVGSGLRRIEALTGRLAQELVFERMDILSEAAQTLKARPETLVASLEAQAARFKALEKELGRYQEASLKSDVENFVASSEKIKGVSFVGHVFANLDMGLLRKAADLLKAKWTAPGVFFLCAVKDADAFFVCGATDDLVKKGVSADAIMKKVLPLVGGSGGGRKDFAQGGTKSVDQVNLVLAEVKKFIEEIL